MDNDKRKLTEKELKRKDCFEKLSSEMQQKGCKMKNVIINTQKAKPLCLFIVLPFMAFILHELIHGITWGLFAKNHFHSIDFGII